jgi:hypothetical protein
LFHHVGVDHEQENSCVQEDHVEGKHDSLLKSFSFSSVSNPIYQSDASFSQEVVETDDDVRQSVSPEYRFIYCRLVSSADHFSSINFCSSVGAIDEFGIAKTLQASC